MGQSYKDLVAWQKAMQLVTQVYVATEDFPRREIYGLTNQIRRAAVSVPSNIAEGQGRKSPREFRHFLATARGSPLEVETQIQIARNLEFLDEAGAARLIELSAEVGRVLNGLIASIKAN